MAPPSGDPPKEEVPDDTPPLTAEELRKLAEDEETRLIMQEVMLHDLGVVRRNDVTTHELPQDCKSFDTLPPCIYVTDISLQPKDIRRQKLSSLVVGRKAAILLLITVVPSVPGRVSDPTPP